VPSRNIFCREENGDYIPARPEAEGVLRFNTVTQGCRKRSAEGTSKTTGGNGLNSKPSAKPASRRWGMWLWKIADCRESEESKSDEREPEGRCCHGLFQVIPLSTMADRERRAYRLSGYSGCFQAGLIDPINILADIGRPGFDKNKTSGHNCRQCNSQSKIAPFVSGNSSEYLLQWAISGDTMRIKGLSPAFTPHHQDMVL